MLMVVVVVVDLVNDGNATLGCKGSSRMNGSVDELVVDWGYDEYMILGCKGNSGLTGSMGELTVESVNEVAAYRVESTAGKTVVCILETGGLHWDKKLANLIASSMYLILVTLTLSNGLWISVLSDFIGAEIIFCFSFTKEVKTGSITVSFKSVLDLFLNNEFSNLKSNSIYDKLTNSLGK